MKGTVSNRDRKNPKSAEAFQKEREKRNRSRGKQIWDGAKWVHITAEQSAKVMS
jgi:hypothetical protein